MNRPQSLAPAFASGHFQHLWDLYIQYAYCRCLDGYPWMLLFARIPTVFRLRCHVKKVSNEGP